MAQHQSIPVMGIRLRKEGRHTIVDAEIGGAWIEVIRELSDNAFCHIVEPDGMYERYYAQPPMTMAELRKEHDRLQAKYGADTSSLTP